MVKEVFATFEDRRILNEGREKEEKKKKNKFIKQYQEVVEEEVKKTCQTEEYKKEIESEKLKEAYDNIIELLKQYLDLKEEYYNLIALWIIGTYFHERFPSYPFLFFNAMRGSGKTRTLNLTTYLSNQGQLLNSLTEAVLFRTTGTLGIDEFEGVSKKGNENLRELLNSAYKKGIMVKRMKQVKTPEGNEQVVESFEVYRPICLANIWGMESVLGDRCLTLVLEKSFHREKVNLIEVFREDKKALKIIKILKECSLCRCSFSVETYKEWNFFITNNYTNSTNYTNNTNNTNYTQLFKRLNLMDLNGRELELSMPLCLIAAEIDKKNYTILKKTTLTLKELFESKREEEFTENLDISLIDFIAQFPVETKVFFSIKKLVQQFKEFLQNDEEWLNTKWLGRALKRLNLISEKRRKSYGVEVILNIEKAQEKIKKFK